MIMGEKIFIGKYTNINFLEFCDLWINILIYGWDYKCSDEGIWLNVWKLWWCYYIKGLFWFRGKVYLICIFKIWKLNFVIFFNI